MTTYLAPLDPADQRFDAMARGAVTATLAAVAAVLVTLLIEPSDALTAWGLVAGATLPAGLAPIGRWRWLVRRAQPLPTAHLDADARAVLVEAATAVARVEAAADGAAPGPVADHLDMLHQRAEDHLRGLHRTLETASSLPSDGRMAVMAESADRGRALQRLARAAERLRAAQPRPDEAAEVSALIDATEALADTLADVERPGQRRAR